MSAKEIATNLGITHHAVEKRLKMARTKLGATSSLEAARMLAEAEGYGQAVTQSPDLAFEPTTPQSSVTRLTVLGAVFMILVGAIALGLLLQPAPVSQAANTQPTGSPGKQMPTSSSVPTAGTEAVLRELVAGLASGSPDYSMLSPQFAEVVRHDLPRTHPLFNSLGELKSVSFRGRGAMGDDAYNLVFANGGVIMSASLDANGKMAGGILQPLGAPAGKGFMHGSMPTAGTETALRKLVAGLSSGSPDYDGLTPQFAEVVRHDLPVTHQMFSSMGKLKSVAFRGRGAMGDDVYSLTFTRGGVIMSAALHADGKMVGGMLQPVAPPMQ